MKPQQEPAHTTRREFLKTTLATSTAAAVSAQSSDSALAAAVKMIGIQVGAVSFVDKGVDRMLEILQKRGAVNTVSLTTFTYGRGLAGRQIPGQPFPDHGVQESDERFFHAGHLRRNPGSLEGGGTRHNLLA